MYIATIHCVIAKLELYVKSQYALLNHRGEESKDLLTYLFEAFEVVYNAICVVHIKRYYDNNEEGKDMATGVLMVTTLNKYQVLVDKNKWRVQSTKQPQIVALSATIKQLKDKDLELTTSLKKLKKSMSTTSGSGKSPLTSSSGGDSGGENRNGEVKRAIAGNSTIMIRNIHAS